MFYVYAYICMLLHYCFCVYVLCIIVFSNVFVGLNELVQYCEYVCEFVWQLCIHMCLCHFVNVCVWGYMLVNVCVCVCNCVYGNTCMCVYGLTLGLFSFAVFIKANLSEIEINIFVAPTKTSTSIYIDKKGLYVICRF